MLPLLVVFGCAALQSQLIDEQDNQVLSAAASEYWLAVRWNDPTAASRWLEGTDQRMKLGKLISEPRFKLIDADVVQVVLGDEFPRERRPDVRDGVAVIRIESVDLLLNRVDVQTLEQHWLKNAVGWHIDAARSPIGVDRPW